MAEAIMERFDPAILGNAPDSQSSPSSAKQPENPAHEAERHSQRTEAGVAAQAAHSRPDIDPEPDREARLKDILAARNPLLRAATPLLRMLAEMPKTLPAGEGVLDTFQDLLAKEVEAFQSLCDKANLRREHVLTARYCLCTALDEAAIGMPWGGTAWAAHSLAERFHRDVEGGRKFFLLVGRLDALRHEHLDLLEVMYRILGLGFQGQYANAPDGARELESVRHHLFTIIHGAQGAVDPALSPHWRVDTEGRFKMLRSLPVWVSASVLGLVLFSVFSWEKYWLMKDTANLETRIAAIAKMAPPPPPRLRLAELLKDEIAAGRVTVKDEETRSSVVFRGDDMFLPAQAAVSPKIGATLNRLAAEVAKVPGKVVITGHSDGVPINTPLFPSNQALSEKRAAAVAAYLAGKGVAKGRLETLGKGDTEPVADNTTPAGRARNRRVEVAVIQ